MNVNELKDNIIYPKLSHDVVFGPLKGFKRRGGAIVADCPACEKKAHFWAYDGKPFGKCYHGGCNKIINWWDFTARHYNLSSNRDILRKLADLAGVELPNQSRPTLSPNNVDDVRRMIVNYGLSSLLSPEGEATRKYLLSRGYTLDEIKRGKLMYVERKKLFDYLRGKGVSVDLIKQTGILTRYFGEDYKLILPFEADGKIHGFIGRLNVDGKTRDKHEFPKYKNSFGLTKELPYGFNHITEKDNYYLVVEGPLDALLLNLRGIKSVALCGCELSTSVEKSLLSLPQLIIVLALDDDIPGRLSTAALIRRMHGKEGRRFLIINDYMGYKDPGELILAKGLDAFKSVLNDSSEAVPWLFRILAPDLINKGAFSQMEEIRMLSRLFQRSGEDEKQLIIEEASRATSLKLETLKTILTTQNF